MRSLLSACFLALAACSAAKAQAPARNTSPIDYVLTPEMDGATLRDLKLEVRFTADASGVTRIDLPSTWSGATELYKAIHDITAEGASVRRDGGEHLTLSSKPNAPVTLRYTVRQDFEGELSVEQGSPFRPVTRPGWFTTVGWALFPEIERRRDAPASFRWGATPQGWTLASDLDHKATEPRHIDDLLDSVLVGGQGMQIVERQAAGGRLRIAFHGDWRFSEGQIADLQTRIVNASADFWKDHGGEFFVAFTPLQAPRGATVQYGVGLGDAFSLWATPNVTEAGLRHILAHEYQHAWLPNRVGGVRSGPDEPLDYWLSEGFTDFYTLRLLLRSGVWSLEDFTTDYNRILKAYAVSSAREAPNRLIAANFWKDREIADLPYQRGLLLAALWDDRLRRESGGRKNLDDVVLDMKARAARDQADDGAVNNLRVAWREEGGQDLGGDMRRYVDGGAAVLLPADLFGSCASVKTYQMPIFDRGFDPEETSAHDGIVGGVDPSGPAWAAGLRNGMRILGREGGDNADSRVDLVYKVDDHGVVKQIRYRPEGKVRATIQEIALAADMSAEKRAACTRSMAGL